MAKSKKLLNCDFLNESSFRSKLSNKAKLLYLYTYINCDDYGFCGSVDDIVDLFNANDSKFHSEGSLDLIQTNYESALKELLERGFLYEFSDSRQNSIYLVRHYHLHNKLREDRVTETNYKKYLNFVRLVDNVYQWTPKLSHLSFKFDSAVIQMSVKCQTNVSQVSDKCQSSVSSIEENRIEVNRRECNRSKDNRKEINIKESNKEKNTEYDFSDENQLF